MGSGSSKKNEGNPTGSSKNVAPFIEQTNLNKAVSSTEIVRADREAGTGGDSSQGGNKPFKTLNCSVLGIQGAGKSTVMKQFCHQYSSGFRLSAEENEDAKTEILDCVITRTKYIIQHICFHSEEEDPDGEKAKTADEKIDEELFPIMDAFDDLRSTYFDSDQLDEKNMAKVLDHLKLIWDSAAVQEAHADPKMQLDIETNIGKSAEIQQKFIAGKFFVDKIASIMCKDYMITQDEHVNVRMWTRSVSNYKLTYGPVEFFFRDVGGDEMSRSSGAWERAIRESFCILFIISLDDYDRFDASSEGESAVEDQKKTKFRTSKNLLWKYVLHEDNQARFVLLLNKRDRFREKLALVPLHEGSHHFRNVPGRAEGETHEQYCERCEAAVIKFFLQSSRVKSNEHSDKYLATSEFTHATDTESFGHIMQKLCVLFKEIWDEKLSEFGFIS